MARTFTPEVVDAIVRVAAEEVRRELAEECRFDWVTLDRAGELLGKSADAVRKQIERGSLPAQKFDGRWYVEIAVLDRSIRESHGSGYDSAP